ncbi:MAG: ion transporter [Phenylobacterium sp.]|uniref:ion transporter n=1 Tax=Phenylobacterium sp. TaxID=1871053 RepID=UPI002732C82B|nr:ion transporter [Phenylobacterium sp.]MDP3174942.1 ion transporter [Phenylobacterium sp.]
MSNAARSAKPHMPPLAAPPGRSTLRRRLYEQLDPRARLAKGLSLINRVIVVLILIATTLAILETEPAFSRFEPEFAATEVGLGLAFALEFILRIWVTAEHGEAEHPWRERMRFLATPSAVADIIAIVSSLALVGGSSAVLLRLVRMGRILRLAKLGRMSRAFDHMVEAVSSRRDELTLSLAAGMFLMITAATALHLAEGSIQPDKFGSIPRALWWSVATMTTIGYGDVYPVTILGKVLAAVTAIFSIGFIAMPTGILAASFSDAMHRHRQALEEAAKAQEAESSEPP